MHAWGYSSKPDHGSWNHQAIKWKEKKKWQNQQECQVFIYCLSTISLRNFSRSIVATEESVNEAEKEKAERRDLTSHHRGNKLKHFVVLWT